jgi:hypothetical protein
MGWETTKTTLECKCVKFRKTHDFFMSGEDINFIFCENHSVDNLPYGKIILFED